MHRQEAATPTLFELQAETTLRLQLVWLLSGLPGCLAPHFMGSFFLGQHAAVLTVLICPCHAPAVKLQA